MRQACKRFDPQAFTEGHMTPIFFGSALKNFGVGDLLNALGELAPPPRTQAADKRVVSATEPGMSAFVFKIQASMDPNHRDRIAFVRLCSGRHRYFHKLYALDIKGRRNRRSSKQCRTTY